MIKRLQDAFYKSGLLGEFLETIINDTNKVMSRKLLRQVWTLVSTEWDHVDDVVTVVEETFSQSTDDADLNRKWRALVAYWWPKLPDMPLKAEIDAL